MNNNLVSAVFDSHADAERAVTQLRGLGVRDDHLSLIAQHEGKTTSHDGAGHEAKEKAGGLIKGVIGGGAVGAILGIAALAIPGVGPLAAAGAIAASAVPEGMAIGAGVGALTGGLSGLLKKHGVSDEDAHYYEQHVNKGGVFVSVDTSDAGVDAERVREILYSSGGHSSSRTRTAAM
jgi:uncharacterized membrane protein